MELVPLEEIIIKEDRIRKRFDVEKEANLSASIYTFGLMHALVVEVDGRTLVAGEQRLHAIKNLQEQNFQFNYNGIPVAPGLIPIVNLSDLTINQYKEAELDENIRRINLTWREKAEAVAELHEIRTREAEERGEVQTKSDTAEELDELSGKERVLSTAIEDVKKDLIVATYSDDPEVMKAKSREEAVKIIEKKLNREHMESLAKEFDVSKTATPHNLIQGDLFKHLPELDEEMFSCIIADPPYGVNADTFAAQSADRHTYEDTPEISNAIVMAIAKEGFRITEKKAHLYIFCDVNRFSLVKRLVSEEGWDVWERPLIWFRGSTSGIAPKPNHGPRRTYEAILFANKGNRRVTALYPDCIVTAPHIRDVARAATKPVELYRHLILQSCLPGDYVLDPCCGSGPVFPAANSLKVVAWGIEKDRHGAGLAASRIRGLE